MARAAWMDWWTSGLMDGARKRLVRSGVRGSSVGQLRAKASVLASGQGIKAVRDELKANLAEAIEF